MRHSRGFGLRPHHAYVFYMNYVGYKEYELFDEDHILIVLSEVCGIERLMICVVAGLWGGVVFRLLIFST